MEHLSAWHVNYTSIRMKKTLLLALFLCAAQTVRADDVPASEASSHVGETATVCGRVTGVHYAANSKGKPTFINFDKPYPSQDFTVMVWDDDRAGFGNLDKYTGRQICAHGVITEYRGKPEMILRSPDALQAK
jgi:hypothetical protein